MIKLATSISHLFADAKCRKIILELSDCLECRDETIDSDIAGQEVFHCQLQPVHPFGKRELEYLARIKNIKPELKLLTFHLASCCKEPQIKEGVFQPAGRQYSDKEMLSNASMNFDALRGIFGKEVEIAIENNNYYPTGAYRYVTEPGFISRLVRNNGLRFLFDIAHAKITAHNQGIKYEDYAARLPLDRIIQIHISSAVINDGALAYDAHNCLSDSDFGELKVFLARVKPTYLTIEYYQDIDNLTMLLKKARGILYEFS